MKRKFVGVILSVLFIFTLTAAADAKPKGLRYMVCTGTNVNVREKPSTKAKVLTKINKGMIWVVEKRDTGEPHPWYYVAASDREADWESDSGELYEELGWVYGQFLRELKIKKDVQFDTANGIAWGTPYSQISGLSKLKEDEESWTATRKGDYKQGDIVFKNVEIEYYFDSKKNLDGFGFFIAGEKCPPDMMRKVEEFLGETNNFSLGEDGFYEFYDFPNFRVDTGWSTYGMGETPLFRLSVVKK